MIKACNSNFQRLGIVRDTTSASRFEELNGENTMDFEAALTPVNAALCQPYTIYEVYGQYFDTGFIEHGKDDDGNPTIRVEGDHISYRLNRQEYDMVPYEEYHDNPDDPDEVTGNNGGFKPVENVSAASLLAQILAGTGFTGSVYGGMIDYYAISGETTRRQMLADLIDMVKGEATYDNFNIRIDQHRGSTAKKAAIVGKNVTSLSKEIDRRTRVPEDEQATKPYYLTYNCQIIDIVESENYNIGDDVRLIDRDLGIDTNQRVVDITSNPNDENEPRIITLGDITHRKFERNLDNLINEKVDDKEDDEDKDIDFGDLEDEINDLRDTDSDLQNQIDNTNKRINNITPGPDPGEQTTDRIYNEDQSQMIITGSSDISITNGGSTYSLQLNPGSTPPANGTPLIKIPGGDILQLKALDRIAYSETDAGAGAVVEGSSVVCTDTQLLLRTGAENPQVPVVLANGKDGDALVTKQSTSGGKTQSTLQFGTITKMAFAETDQFGPTTVKSAVECQTDRISLKVAENEYVTNLAGNAAGKCLLGVNTGTAKVLLFDFLKKLAFAVTTMEGGQEKVTEKSNVECTETSIKLMIGADTYELDLANGQDGYQLVKRGQKIMFQAAGGLGAVANIKIVTSLPAADAALPETLYLLYDA